jgi:hypothetical protein
MATRVLMAILIRVSTGPAADARLRRIRRSCSRPARRCGCGPALCRSGYLRGRADVRPIDAPAQSPGRAEAQRAGIKHVRAGRPYPRLVVRIEGAQVSDDDKFVCRVQVALIRHVLLSSPPNLPLSAESGRAGRRWRWSRGEHGRDDFVRRCRPDGGSLTATKEPPSQGFHQVSCRMARAQQHPVSFPLFKTSQVFHRPDCRWAQDIASDSRVGYKKPGKRLCRPANDRVRPASRRCVRSHTVRRFFGSVKRIVT